jgi:hypothetical protein
LYYFHILFFFAGVGLCCAFFGCLMAEAFEGPVKVLVKKRWVSGYGRAAAGALVVSESVLGGAVLGQASLAEPARRGLPADAPPPPPGEENCQFALGAALVLSAPSFAASSDWMAALKSHSPAVSSARAQVLRSASASSLSSAASSSSSSLSLSEPVSLPAAVAALLGTASSGSSGAAECARVARPVQSLAMSELKRFKALLQQQPRETAASRHLEAAVAELAGLLKELVGALRMYAETEDLPEKQRLKQLTRDVGDAHARALAREEASKEDVFFFFFFFFFLFIFVYLFFFFFVFGTGTAAGGWQGELELAAGSAAAQRAGRGGGDAGGGGEQRAQRGGGRHQAGAESRHGAAARRQTACRLQPVRARARRARGSEINLLLLLLFFCQQRSEKRWLRAHRR